MFDSDRPPRLANLLLRPFSGEPDFPQIEGDMREEFHNRIQTSGVQTANSWYRREALRNVWALSRRPRVIQVFLMAVLAVLVYRFTVPLSARWLSPALHAAPRIPGLQFSLVFTFAAVVSLSMGALMTRGVRGRERMLRLSFSGLFTLFIIGRGWMIGYYDIRFLLYPITSALILVAFWIGSLWVSRDGLRRRTA
jgi:hypothetical protein